MGPKLAVLFQSGDTEKRKKKFLVQWMREKKQFVIAWNSCQQKVWIFHEKFLLNCDYFPVCWCHSGISILTRPGAVLDGCEGVGLVYE